MIKSRYIYTKPLLRVFMLLFSMQVFSQTNILAPEVDVVSAACRNSASNNTNFVFRFTGDPFNDANDFIVELSDENGNFDNPINIGILTDQEFNIAFLRGVDGSFSIPEGTAGDGYRIQVRSTDPAFTSLPSEPFAAYFHPDERVIVNNNENITICNGTATEIAITLSDPAVNVDDYQYAWFLNNNRINGETGSTLMVDTPGTYFARYLLGDTCTLIADNSNSITVSSANVEQIFIEGDNTVNLCANETYDLVASVDNTTYGYTWIRDGEVLIDNVYMPVFTTPNTDQYGIYELIVNANGCVVNSQEVTVQPLEGAGFELSIESALTRVLLPTETINLSVEVTTNSNELSYQWFKDGQALFNMQPEINIIDDGVYFVEVTDTSSSCAVAVTSEEYTFLDATLLEPLVRVDNYEECNSTSARLTTIGVNAIATDGLSYELSTEQLELLRLQWLFNDVAIAGENDNDIDVISYVNNGDYKLNAAVGGGVTEIVGDSATEPILLSPGSQIESSSISNRLCTGSVINLSIENLTGFSYTWFKDDVALIVDDTSSVDVGEVGSYYVVYDGFGCSNVTETIEILEFDEDVLELDPSSVAVLIAESTVVLSATGADSYEWFNEDGDLLSNNETLEVGIIGFYTVVGSVGDCQIEKEIEVVADDGSVIIPNIISPFNGDNVNDTWNIPNRFSFQSDVQVIIYNSKGGEVLNTFDYQNDWPQADNDLLRGGLLFYFKVIQEENLIKAGTISVLE